MKDFSYRSILLSVSIFIAIIAIAFVAFNSYTSTVGYIVNKLDKINYGVLVQDATSIENNMGQIKKITEYVATDASIIDAIKQYDFGTLSSVDSIEKVKNRISIMKQFNNYISNIAVITRNNSIITGYDTGIYNLDYELIQQSGLLESTDGNISKAVLLTPFASDNHFGNNFFDILKSSYSFTAIIKDEYQELGCVFVLVNSEVFNDNLSDNSFLIDDNLSIVGMGKGISYQYVQPAVEKFGTQQCDNKDSNIEYIKSKGYKAYYKSINSMTMRIFYMQKDSDFSKNIKEYRRYIFIAFFAVIVLAFFLFEIISQKIVYPLKLITDDVRNYMLGKKYATNQNAKLKPKSGLNFSLRESILGYLIIVIILPIGIFLVISFYIGSNIIEEYIINSNSNAFYRTLENINYYIDTKEKILKNIAYNIYLQNSLSGQVSKGDISIVVERSLKLGNGRDETFIYANTGSMIFTNSNSDSNTLVDKSIFLESQNKREIATWCDTIEDDYGRIVFSLLLKVNSLKEFNNIGFIQAQLSESDLENIYKNIINDYSVIYIVNKDGRIISHPEKKLIGSDTEKLIITDETAFKKESDGFIFKQSIRGTQWFLVGQYSLDLIKVDRHTMLIEKVYIFSLILFSLVIIAYFLAFGLTRSLNKFNKSLKKITLEDLNTIFPINTKVNEINELGTAFNEMVHRNQKLLNQLLDSSQKQIELEKRKKESELTALQFQINPHFLYNTFGSINWLIKSERKKEALNMIDSLSQFLRHVAKADSPVVSISEEIEHVNHYITIMKMRFGEQIDFICDISKDILMAKTLRLSLQPIIENSIYHGIHPSHKDGIIEIEGYRGDNNDIIFTVSDNGAGITSENIEKITCEINSDEAGQSIGLHNIQSRIKLYFGQEYGISIYSRENVGTTVVIRIPQVF